MKLYEAYEDEYTTYYIAAHNEEEAFDILKRELIEEDRDEEDVELFSFDEIILKNPRIIAINTFIE